MTIIPAKKSLGQHFLLDENICAKIAACAGDVSQCSVIEVGPGPGGLTRALLNAGAKRLIAIEKDRRFATALHEWGEARLSIVEADAMEVDIPSLAPAPRKIVANLPYNVGTALLLKWLGEIGERREARVKSEEINPLLPPASCLLPYLSLTLMFQREVAGRIMAAPGSKEYGRLSVIAQWLCAVEHHFDLPPGAFSPPPKVYSSVITLTPRPQPLYPAHKETLEKVVASAFNQRRKMLRQSLKTLGVDAEALLAAAGIDGTRRAETLSVEEFCRLAGKL